jgi:tetratricopeptide (TPR) repeat protein
LTAVPRLADADDLRGEVAATLVTCLGPGPGEHVAIRPDPVGDHHLLTVLARRPDLLGRCLSAGTGMVEDDVAEGTFNALTVLTRAGRSGPEDAAGAAAHIEALLRTEPGRWPVAAAVATALGGVAASVLEALAAAPDTPLPLDDLSAGLPFGAGGLWRLGLIVDERRLRRALAVGSTRPGGPIALGDGRDKLADLWALVSYRRRDAGDRTGALAAAQEAVTRYRALARTDQTGHTAALAVLNDLCVHHGDVGDRDAARTAAEEAVALYRQLVADHPDQFAALLAAALNNLATSRSATGDRRGALEVVAEAAAIHRALAAQSADQVENLAMSLNNLANCLSDVQDLAGALRAGEESVLLRRRLTDDTNAEDLALA